VVEGRGNGKKLFSEVYSREYQGIPQTDPYGKLALQIGDHGPIGPQILNHHPDHITVRTAYAAPKFLGPILGRPKEEGKQKKGKKNNFIPHPNFSKMPHSGSPGNRSTEIRFPFLGGSGKAVCHRNK